MPKPSRARCAAEFGNKYSIASLLGFQGFWGQSFLGNDISTTVSMFTGPNRAGAVTSFFTTNPTPINETAITAKLLGSVGVGRARAVLGVNGAGNYFVKTFARTPLASLIPAGAKAVVGNAMLAKLGYDAATFGLGLLTCGG
jgi:hypothetical protein